MVRVSDRVGLGLSVRAGVSRGWTWVVLEAGARVRRFCLALRLFLVLRLIAVFLARVRVSLGMVMILGWGQGD